jgi:nucleotide-binding universal stress UspA family protein
MADLLQQLTTIYVPVDDDVAGHHRAIDLAERVVSSLGLEIELVTVGEPAAPMTGSASIIGVEGVIAGLAGRPDVLVCMTSRGASSVGEMLHGSVSSAVVRALHHPVLIVGPHSDGALTGTICAIAVDGSAEAEAIVPFATALAMAIGLRPVLYQAGMVGSAVPHDAVESGYLHRLAESAVPGTPLDFETLHGTSAEDALVDLASHGDVAMLAMTTRSVTALQRLLHGSVAADVVRHATCPVLVQSIW